MNTLWMDIIRPWIDGKSEHRWIFVQKKSVFEVKFPFNQFYRNLVICSGLPWISGNAPTKGVVPRHVRTWIIISPWHDSILNNAQNGVVVPIPTWTIWITRGVHQSWPCSICSASHLLLALRLLSYSLPLTTRIIAVFATEPNKKLHYSLLVGGCNPTNID